jgi:hypothetical protein
LRGGLWGSMKIAFDFGGTLNDLPQLEKILRSCAAQGHECYIISAASSTMDIETYTESLRHWCCEFKERNWPVVERIVTPWHDTFYEIGQDKAKIMKEKGIELLFDDEPEVCRAVREVGLLAFQVK